jgi:26 proteasome complex subunit DSS1
MAETTGADEKPAGKNDKVDLGLLEEDDEFEEFETEDWKQDDKDAEADNLWEDNWDDDNIEDDFTLQLRFV